MSSAPDGSPVELYALLPELGEADLVAQAVRAGGSVLELGCGTGRITRQLVRLGFHVTAVDESAEMLAHVDGADTVCLRIEELELARRTGPVVHGTVEYVSGSRRWTHEFAMHVFADEGELETALAEEGLRLDRRLDGEKGRWFVTVVDAD